MRHDRCGKRLAPNIGLSNPDHASRYVRRSIRLFRRGMPPIEWLRCDLPRFDGLAGRGNAEWHKMARVEDVAACYDNQSTSTLCKLSGEVGRTEMQLVQRHIENARQRRGAPLATCHPPVEGPVAAKDLKSGA
jgi:hypothetical protein